MSRECTNLFLVISKTFRYRTATRENTKFLLFHQNSPNRFLNSIDKSLHSFFGFYEHTHTHIRQNSFTKCVCVLTQALENCEFLSNVSGKKT